MEPTTQSHTEKIRLTFLGRSLDYGGAQRQLVTLAKALDKTTFDVTVLTFYSGQPLEPELNGTGVRIVSLDKHGRWDLFAFLGRLIRQLKQLRPDIVHGYLDIPNVLALLLKPFVHARVVWGVRASEIELRNYNWLLRLAAWIERLLSSFPDLIIVNSVAARDYHLDKGFPSSKLVMISNGIDTEAFKPDSEARAKVRSELGITESVRLIGTVGRIDPVKDLPVFLQAAPIVCRQISGASFLCAGAGPAEYTQQLKALAGDLGIAEKVIWLDARQDVAAVYNALDLLVSSSRAESFPNAVAEAMSCGVPCVVTDVGDSALVVGDCGIVVPPKNPEALAAGIVNSLDASRTTAGSKCRSRIIENFSVEQLAKLTEQAIKTLLRI